MGVGGGGLSEKKKKHSETLFPAFLQTKYQFPRQGWSSVKFSLNNKILNENGQMVGERGGGMATTENFVEIKRETNQIFHSISK